VIAFTGSRAVGLEIAAAAAVTADTHQHVKKVICEMGGKNAIIVDRTSDLDAAVLAVRGSAFGYSGQKCSACSRAIVVDAVHDTFVRRLTASTKCLTIGDPAEAATDIGPLIDAEAAAKVKRYIEIGRREGTLELAMEAPPDLEMPDGKPFVGPHIFSGIQREQRIARDEIFGPVLSVMRAADFDEALDIAIDLPDRLTGGVFSRTPSHLQAARKHFRVGNLYLNRGITGALVGRQPFGGLGLSGIGAKAGGEGYLEQFVEPRACSENTMRRGFAPDEEG
jgi:RHH-type proline utilization regulon transcriptional repressor/proline dehydrogenase/delta 1-pyrroline-5-carboxylate dehydrogenase